MLLTWAQGMHVEHYVSNGSVSSVLYMLSRSRFVSDAELIIIFGTHFALSCLGMYVAWFRAALFRRYLDWNSRMFSITARGRAWMSSSFYFWSMRVVVSCLFLLSLVGVVGLLIEIF